MKIQQTPPYNPTMGIRMGNTRTAMYAPSCYITKDLGRFKDYKIQITKNYINNKLASTLYYVTDKVGKWLGSKLKYIENGKQKIIWSKKNV
jgi:hypothetical protein